MSFQQVRSARATRSGLSCRCAALSEERLDDLRQEIQARLAEFPERFPSSHLIRAVEMDTSPEGISYVFFREHIEPGAQQTQETAEQIRNGRYCCRPRCRCRTIGPSHHAPAWAPDSSRFRRPSAQGAGVGGRRQCRGAVSGLRPSRTRDHRPAPGRSPRRSTAGFPGALTGQATIDDLRRANDSISMDRNEYAVIGHDPSRGQRFMRERPPEDVARERDAIVRASEFAQSLQVHPDIDVGQPTELTEPRGQRGSRPVIPHVAGYARRRHS